MSLDSDGRVLAASVMGLPLRGHPVPSCLGRTSALSAAAIDVTAAEGSRFLFRDLVVNSLNALALQRKAVSGTALSCLMTGLNQAQYSGLPC